MSFLRPPCPFRVIDLPPSLPPSQRIGTRFAAVKGSDNPPPERMLHQPPTLSALDPEIQSIILSALPHAFLVLARYVCKMWRALVFVEDGLMRVRGATVADIPPPAPADRRWSTLCDSLAARGWTRCVIWAHAAGHPWGRGTCDAALRGGHMDTFVELREAGCPCPTATRIETPSRVSKTAGHMSASLTRLRLGADDPRDSNIFAFRWAEQPGGRVGMVQELLDNDPDAFGRFERQMMALAQTEGDLSVLRLLREKGFAWCGDVWCDLVRAGRTGFVLRCCSDESIASRDRYDSLDASESAFVREEAARKVAADAAGHRWLGVAESAACEAAAEVGDVEAMRGLRAAGFAWTGDECAHAAAGGHFGALRWLLDNGAPWLTVHHHHHQHHHSRDESAEEDASSDSETGTLDRLYGIGPVREKAWKALITKGDMETIISAHQAGFAASFYDKTCTYAARAGRMDVLRWALSTERDGGVRSLLLHWGGGTCAAAASRGHLSTLDWLRSHDCPWDARALIGAIQAGRPDIFRWAARNGCPFSREGMWLAEEDDDLPWELEDATTHDIWRCGTGFCHSSAKKSGCEPSDFGREMARPVDAMLSAAVSMGYHGLVRHLIDDRGAEWTAESIASACEGSDVSTLRHLPAERIGEAMDAAIFSDTPAAVAWLRPDAATLWRKAVEARSLRVLRWAVDSVAAAPSVELRRALLAIGVVERKADDDRDDGEDGDGNSLAARDRELREALAAAVLRRGFCC
jgi:hypothetical protein